MRSKILIAFVLLVFIVSQSFQCDRGLPVNCSSYVQDTVLLNASVINSSPVYHLYDTVWIGSVVSDNFTPLSGSGSFTTALDQLFLYAQPFSITNISSFPQLQYANIEFNPVIKEGVLQNPGFNGYNFLYKRTTAVNSLKIGFVAGRTGLYIIQTNNDRYYSGGSLALYKSNDFCTTYHGISTFASAEQNKNYWDTLGVAAISLPPSYGGTIISKNMRNYFFFKVIP